MTIKTYESPKSVVANITVIVGGKPRKVSFYPVSEHMGMRTGLGSMFKTSDERLQRAIEKSNLFGSRVFLIKTEEVAEEKPAADADGTGAENVVTDSNESDQKEKYLKITKKEVSSNNDAREWLIENYKDVAPKSMPNVKSIINCGLRHGVVFEIFDEQE